jgi:zinc protease
VAYSTSPYRNPIIGWMQDLEDMTLTDLAEWYKRWYAPNNATLVVAGDVQANEVFELAEKYFGELPAVSFEPVKKRQEIPQVGIRRAIIKQTAKVPYLLMGYKVPVLNSVTDEDEADVYALEMLAGVLSGGGSSRLTSDLVREQQIASSISAGFDLYSRLPSLFTFDGVPTDKYDLNALEQAVYKQIKRLKTELVSEQELTRIKAQVIAASVYEKDSNFYQAMQLGRLETVGLSWKKEAQYVDKLKQVTPEQIQAVAHKYFNEDQLTVVYMQPEAVATESNKKAGGK